MCNAIRFSGSAHLAARPKSPCVPRSPELEVILGMDRVTSWPTHRIRSFLALQRPRLSLPR